MADEQLAVSGCNSVALMAFHHGAAAAGKRTVGAEAVLCAVAGSRLARDGVVCKPRAPAWMKLSAATLIRQATAGKGDLAGNRHLH